MSASAAQNLLAGVALTATLAVGVCAPASANQQDGFQVQAPHYGEVLFYFYQQQHFTALTNLLVSRDFTRLTNHESEAELLQGGLLLSWGQHDEAADIFERLLVEVDDQSVRDRTWFYLGKVRFQRGFVVDAEQAFDSIVGNLPPELDAERYNLVARIYMDQGRFAEAAAVLSDWEGPDDWMVYARYNLGVALIRMGEIEYGAELLERVGTMRADTEELKAVRDRANVALGFAYLQADLVGDAKPALQRVRVNGPFSNKALLGAGWANSANEDYSKALAPWMTLSQRDLLDSAVQESLLAVPYAFAQLGAEPQAAQFYAQALDVFDAEVARLDQAVVELRKGELLPALLAEDRSAVSGWYWQLENIPDSDRTRYLYFTIADHQFHEGLKSYRDLVAMQEYLQQWLGKLTTYRDMLETRERAYAEKLPLMRERMAVFDLATLQERYDTLQLRSRQAREQHDVVALATPEQQVQWSVLSSLEESPAWGSDSAKAQRDKQRVLKGVLLWDMEREFKVRAWRQDQELAELHEVLSEATCRFKSFDEAVASIPETVSEFSSRIARLELQVFKLQSQLERAISQHEDYLNGIVVAEMQQQRERVLTYRAQARFALASIYDRMQASNTNKNGNNSNQEQGR